MRIVNRDLIPNEVYENLPEDLKLLTSNFQGREKDIVLLSSLGVISNCLPNYYGIYDGKKVYPQFYLLIIAPPASGKGEMIYSRLLIDPINECIKEEGLRKIAEVKKRNQEKTIDKAEKLPPIEIKIIPGNTSSSDFYYHLGNSKHGVLIFENEADTIGNMMKTEWGNYSDILRKAFHHEPVSISRKVEKLNKSIPSPKVALVISGTPNQLQPLIDSRENGLFSRFLFYNFSESSEFKNVFDKKLLDNEVNFEIVAVDIKELYFTLDSRTEPLEFSFTEKQQLEFHEIMKPLYKYVLEDDKEYFISSVKRLGLIWFRIAMILTALRLKKSIKYSHNKIFCEDVDFNSSRLISQTLIEHSEFTYDEMGENLPIQDQKLLRQLSNEFSSKEAYDVGDKNNVSKRTIDSKLDQWVRKGIISRISKGNYTKNKL